jgi:hypothetical protein
MKIVYWAVLGIFVLTAALAGPAQAGQVNAAGHSNASGASPDNGIDPSTGLPWGTKGPGIVTPPAKTPAATARRRAHPAGQ